MIIRINVTLDDQHSDSQRSADALCEAYQAAVANGEPPPSLAILFAKLPASERHDGAIRLIGLDAKRRAAAGEKPTVDDYAGLAHGLDDSQIRAALETLHRDGSVEETMSVATTDAQPRPTTLTRRRGPDLSKQIIGDYELEEQIAEGGMGVVYRARQISLNRIVAVKMIRSGQFASDAELHRFQAEAEAAARLDHPGIVPIYEVGEADGHHYFSMGFVEGQSLAFRLARGPLAPRQAAELIIAIADAMHYAHSNGVIHRDLKPGNILLVAHAHDSETSATASSATGASPTESDPAYSPRVTDFGLAKQIDDQCHLTVSGQVLGTPGYMPPEQATGSLDIGVEADVYSLGALLYAVLTARPPFQAANVVDTIRQVIESEPAAPSSLNPKIPGDLETICLKAMQKPIARRYSTASDLAADLRRHLNDEPILARPVGRTERIWRWCRRNPFKAGSIISVGALAFAIAVLVIIGSQLQLSRANERARESELDAQKKAARLQELELESAREIAEQKTELAETNRYYALLNGVRERANSKPEIGWTKKSLADLRIAAGLEVEARDLLELRNEAVQCITSFDLEPQHQLAMPPLHKPYAFSFHSDGKRLAVGAVRSQFSRATVFDLETGKAIHNVGTPTPALFGIEGIRQIAFADNGNTLVASTRSGYVNRWDLTSPTPTFTRFQIPNGFENTFAFWPDGEGALNVIGHKVFDWPRFGEPANLMADVKLPNYDVAVTQSGKWFSSGRIDDTRLVWRGGEIVRRIRGVSGFVAFSHKDRYLIAAEQEQVTFVDLVSGKLIRRIVDPESRRAHERRLAIVDATPAGDLAATFAFDSSAKIWDTASGRLLMTVPAPKLEEVRGGLSADGRYFAITGNTNVQLYELKGRSTHWSISKQPGQIIDFAVAKDAPRIACLSLEQKSKHRVTVWNNDSDELIDAWTTPNGWDYGRIAVSDDGTRLVVSDEQEPVDTRCWTFGTDGDTNRLPQSPLTASRRGAHLIAKQQVTQIAQDAFTVSQRRPFAEGKWPFDEIDAAMGADNGAMYLFRGDQVCVWDAKSKSMIEDPKMIVDVFPGMWERDIDAAARISNGEAVFYRDGYRFIWNFETQTMRGPAKCDYNDWDFEKGPIDAALDYSYDSGGVWVIQGDRCALLYAIDKQLKTSPISKVFPGAKVKELTAAVNTHRQYTPRRPHRFHRNDREVKRGAIALGEKGTVLWTVEDGDELTISTLPEFKTLSQWSNKADTTISGAGTINDVAVGDQWAAVGVRSGDFAVFDAATRKLAYRVKTAAPIRRVAIRNDDHFAAVGLQNGQVGIATLDPPAPPSVVDAHRAPITGLAFSASGRRLASAAGDRKIKIWRCNGDQLELLYELPVSGPPMKVLFDRKDERLFASVRGDSAIRVWDLSQIEADLDGLGLGTSQTR